MNPLVEGEQFFKQLWEAHKIELAQLATAYNAINKDRHLEQMTELVQNLCEISRRFAFHTHQLKFHFDWGILPQPEWHDHFLDQYFQFCQGKSLWAERGVYSVLALKRGGTSLELCCGDGFNTKYFYGALVSKIIAVDFDPSAINHATRYNSAENIDYQLLDIREGIPDNTFDNIIWDAAIEHFTEAEIHAILTNIRLSLGNEGVLSGYTMVEHPSGVKANAEHEREFKSKEDLASFLEPYFSNCCVFETIHPERHNLYFYASQGVIPFDQNWENGLQLKKS